MSNGGEIPGGRERTLSEKLPDNFEVKTQTETKRAPIITPGVHLTGAMEIHRLTVENKLMGREAELTVDLINATCTTDGWTNYKEATPLWLACNSESWESALLLLSKGADPNLPAIWSGDGSVTTPLFWAADEGSLETVRELLKRGARQDSGESPLKVAKMKNRAKIAELLMEAALATGEKKVEPGSLLEHLNDQIKWMKKKLECPVCFKVAAAPLFCCPRQHLICSECRPQVSKCPLCRNPAEPIRFWLMEEIAEELEKVRQKRIQILS